MPFARKDGTLVDGSFLPGLELTFNDETFFNSFLWSNATWLTDIGYKLVLSFQIHDNDVWVVFCCK